MNDAKRSEIFQIVKRFQVTADELFNWSLHPKFDKRIIGFYIRLDFGGYVGINVGRVESKVLFFFDFSVLYTNPSEFSHYQVFGWEGHIK